MTTPSMNRRGRLWRRFVGGLTAAALLMQVGCYTYLPLQTSAPATGKRIALVLNDRGRLALGDRLGSAIDRVDGLFVQRDSLSVSLEVYRTTDLRGNNVTWTGELVQLPRDGITGYQEREFSRRRTTLLIGSMVGVVAASMLMVNLDIFGSLTQSKPGDGGSSGESR
ncbi:MAG: hypothetical protein P3B98_10370 [Gemmatimonadota bacterium]|nr:hypothetical protein [Gemmatimonadota bacterium]